MWDLRPFLLLGILSMTGASQLVITPSRKEHSVYQGEKFFVSCSSNATNVQRVMWTGPEGQQITDYTGSVPQNNIPRIYVEDGRSGHKGVDLVFENISRTDRGSYTCSANVDGKEESVSFQLFVHKYIDFEDTPTVQYLEEDRDSVLRCDVDGDPAPRIAWTAKGKKVKFDGKYSADLENPNYLIVHNATLEDAGEYLCRAWQLSSRTSNIETLKIDVKVHHKPRSSNDNNDQAYSYVSGTVNLTCEAIAEPKANFSWMKDQQTLVPSERVQIISYPNKSILQLTVEDPNMFGDYECIAENHLGTLERVIILERGSKPAKPTLKVMRAEVNALHLMMDAQNHPDMPIMGFKVQYKKAGDDWGFAHATEFKKGESYIINSLTDDTLYVIRAYARNAAGLSDYSDEVMERTKKVEAMNVTSYSSPVTSSSSLVFFSLLLATYLISL
ncbi:neural cell adhesion molecule 1-like isoform X3 [Macrobrachium rosenbergii]|uniref:neural cell adhesion molecule 1-like isoform X3 n=1 Tax=Macrobrachium rosenbergii TaxID=79674 RepID=UPI0034D75A07